MAKSGTTIENINWAIYALKKDEFTLDELSNYLKKIYPRWAPSDRILKRYLRWPQINAEPHNGKYLRINR